MPGEQLAVVAIDVGGSSLKAGIFGPAGLAVLRRIPSGRERGPDAVLDGIGDVAAALVGEASEAGLEVVGIGVAVPGIVDESGVGRLSVTMGWRDLPVRERLVSRLARPVCVGHDVRTGAVAEATFGAAAGARSAMFVPIGTGLSAAIVLDGVIHAGATFRAGEIGQIIVAAPSTTLEDVASARGITERYRSAAGSQGDGVEAREVAELVAAGDAIARAVWADAVDALAAVLASCITTLDVEVVVIGGGLARCGDTLMHPLRASIARLLPWRETPTIVVARFAANAGFLGAAIEAWRVAGGRDVGELWAAVDAARWGTSDLTRRPR